MTAQQETGAPERALPNGAPLRAVPGGQSQVQPGPAGATRARQLEDVWDRHGASVYALACALLGDEAAATQAVTWGMIDLARSDEASTPDAHRCLARHVYWRSKELASEAPGTQHLPPAMVWLARLAPLQRACLALCCFGGHTHREAAALLEVPPVTVAELLTAGLREMAEFPAARIPPRP